MSEEDTMGKKRPWWSRLDVFGLTRRGSAASLLIGILVASAMRLWRGLTTGVLILLLVYWMYGGIVTLLLLIVAILGFLYHVQDHLLYYPEQPSHSRFYVESPSLFNLPFENIFIKSKDGTRINLLFVKRPESDFSSAATVIYLHGNAGNVGHRLLNACILQTYIGANVLLVEYRGYGKSGGSANEQGIYLDAQAAMEYIFERTDIDQSKLVIFGRSLGGAVAIETASRPHIAQRIQCLILENTFTSLPEIARVVFDFRILAVLPDWCYKNQYPSRSRIRQVTAPTLFISGLSDNLIPPPMMLHLYEASGSALKRIVRFEQGTHNETWQCQGYLETINRFLVECDQYQKGQQSTAAASYSLEIPFNDGGAQLI